MRPEHFDLAVFDVDGTLYSQAHLRRLMLLDMLLAFARGRLSVPEARLLQLYRRCREEVAEDGATTEEAVRVAAQRFGCSEENVRRVESEWLLRRPLAHLASLAFPEALELVASVRNRGLAVAAWSDYPARDKLQALGFEFDYVVSAADRDVRRLKPDPAGLVKAMELSGARAQRTILVGDRDDRDGIAARAAGVRFVLAERGVRGSVIHAVEEALARPTDSTLTKVM